MAAVYEPIPQNHADDDGTTPSTLLERIGRPEVERWTGHPFVRGLADGSLPAEAFRWYLQQDWLYLKNYVRVYARLAGQAPDDAVEHLVGLAHDLARTELGLIREMMAPYGVRFEGVEPTPVNARYQAFLLDAAAGDFATGVAATMPCLWGYSMMSRSLPEPAAGTPVRRLAAHVPGRRHVGQHPAPARPPRPGRRRPRHRGDGLPHGVRGSSGSSGPTPTSMGEVDRRGRGSLAG